MNRATWAGVLACVLTTVGSWQAARADGRVDDIRERGALHCGIWPHVAGFAEQRANVYVGFEIDLCRAIAVAILADPDKVEFIHVAHLDEMRRRSDIDLAIRRLTRTAERELGSGMRFGNTVFHDGQGFLVDRRRGIRNASALTQGTICVMDRERHPRILFDYLQREARHRVGMLLVESDAQAEAELSAGRCVAYSADVSWLAAARASFADGVSRYEILPDLISAEPLAPLMRADDADLLRTVNIVIRSLIRAEEEGITRALPQPQVTGDGMAADAQFDAQLPAIVAAVGNYGELYERHLGQSSPIMLSRGVNELCSRGGRLCVPSSD